MEINIYTETVYSEEPKEIIHINNKSFTVIDSYTLYDMTKVYRFRLDNSVNAMVFNHDCYGWQMDTKTITLLQAYKVI